MTQKTSPFTYTSVHTRPGTTQHHGPSRPRSRLRLVNQSNADENHLLSLLPPQTAPNPSFVYWTSSTTLPSQGLNDSGCTTFPWRGLHCSQIERTHHLEFFFPFIESNFSSPSFPTVMFLLDPSGPPTVPALPACRAEFPNVTWSLTHFLNCQQSRLWHWGPNP